MGRPSWQGEESVLMSINRSSELLSNLFVSLGIMSCTWSKGGCHFWLCFFFLTQLLRMHAKTYFQRQSDHMLLANLNCRAVSQDFDRCLLHVYVSPLVHYKSIDRW